MFERVLVVSPHCPFENLDAPICQHTVGVTKGILHLFPSHAGFLAKDSFLHGEFVGQLVDSLYNLFRALESTDAIAQVLTICRTSCPIVLSFASCAADEFILAAMALLLPTHPPNLFVGER